MRKVLVFVFLLMFIINSFAGLKEAMELLKFTEIEYFGDEIPDQLQIPLVFIGAKLGDKFYEKSGYLGKIKANHMEIEGSGYLPVNEVYTGKLLGKFYVMILAEHLLIGFSDDFDHDGVPARYLMMIINIDKGTQSLFFIK